MWDHVGSCGYNVKILITKARWYSEYFLRTSTPSWGLSQALKINDPPTASYVWWTSGTSGLVIWMPGIIHQASLVKRPSWLGHCSDYTGWGGWGSYGIDSPRKSPKKPESWRCNAVSRWWKRTSSGGSTTTQMWQSWPPPWNRLSILPTFSASRTGTCSQRRSWKLWLCREATSTRACPVTRKSCWSTEDHRLFCRWEINGNFPINH